MFHYKEKDAVPNSAKDTVVTVPIELFTKQNDQIHRQQQVMKCNTVVLLFVNY